MFDDLEAGGIEYGDRVDARLGYVNPPVAGRQTGGHDAAQRPAFTVAEKRSCERRECGLAEQMAAVGAHLGNRILMGQRDKNRVRCCGHPAGRGSAYGLAAGLSNPGPQAQL